MPTVCTLCLEEIKNVNKIGNFRRAKFCPDSCSLRKMRSLFDSKIRTDLRHLFAFIHYLIHYPQGGNCAKSALASCRSAESSRNLYRPWAWKSLCKSNIDHEKDGCQATWKGRISFPHSFCRNGWHQRDRSTPPVRKHGPFASISGNCRQTRGQRGLALSCAVVRCVECCA